MPEFASLLQQGNAWLFIPTAILLGALHGLEPGHSKTMMASFIIAIRGTVSQAVLLGIAAATSHTAIVWVVALAGLYFGSRWNADSTEPYLQIISAVLIIGTALWMMRRVWQQEQAANSAAHHDHHEHDHDHDHDQVKASSLANDPKQYQDAHELAHANDIKKRFTNQHVTTGQIVMFGLTGGLIPCPASVAVLLLCLQLKRVTLGATLVLGFSVGLALTLVLSGTIAALSVRYVNEYVNEHVNKRFSGFGDWARKAPYFSSALMILIGVYLGYEGLSKLIKIG